MLAALFWLSCATVLQAQPGTPTTQAELQARLDAGGVIHLPPTHIALTGSLYVRRSVTVIGGGSRSQLVAPETSNWPAIVVATDERVRLSDFAVTAGGRRPDGAIGILVQGSQPGTMSYALTLENLDIAYHGIGVDIRAASRYRIVGCYIVESGQIGIRINNAVNADTGDGMIAETTFDTSAAALAAVYWQSGGGLRFINNKVLHHDYGLWLDLAPAVQTSILIATGNSLEHQRVNVRITRATASASFNGVVVTANQMVSKNGTHVEIPAWVNDVTVGQNALVR